MNDVVILGAGPAGLTLGCLLADAGIRCVILEKLNHPRPHVGESLMPATIRTIREIGFHDLVESAGFPRSHGVVYHPPSGSDLPLLYGRFPQGGIDQDYTYHVDRARFDMLLMKHAEAKGCRIVQGVGVEEVSFDAVGRAEGVRVSLAGQSVSVPSRVVVDAAGRSTRIGRQLGLRRDHPHLDQFALHTWCVDIDRGKSRSEAYTHVYFLPEIGGWAWHVPIDREITSLGLVSARSAYRSSGLDVEEFFHASLQGNSKLARATRDARRINDLKGELNYSYRLDRVCGDGWVAIGDAARFIDPVFSSGVTVAMQSATSAARHIQAALERGDTSRSAFLPYEVDVFAGAAMWDDFIRLFYRLLPGFLDLMRSSPHQATLMRMIQGELDPSSGAPVLEELRSIVRTVEQADTHPWHADLVEVPG